MDARRTFAVVDAVELLRHWYAGDTVSEMARAPGLDRKTVRKYIGRTQAEWSALVREWLPQLSDPRARSVFDNPIVDHPDHRKADHPFLSSLSLFQTCRCSRGSGTTRLPRARCGYGG